MPGNYYIHKKTGEIKFDLWAEDRRDYYSKREYSYIKAIRKHPEWYKKIDKNNNNTD